MKKYVKENVVHRGDDGVTIRQRLEEEEERRLSPLAARSSLTRGRRDQLVPCDFRTEFQRDRDRIVHCKSFRRLKYKTQCFLPGEGDHYRTRLTHTLEVSQVARTIARCLFLNEDLAEAIALGHDLGHTCFGHMGERTLDRLLEGGFRHNEHSLRVVQELERDGAGLNLCYEVRDGILRHTGDALPETLEGQAVRLADRIAYLSHDIDDATRAGVIAPQDVPARAREAMGSTGGERINAMVRDVVTYSQDKPRVAASPDMKQAMDELRDFMFERVYFRPEALEEERKADHALEQLYRHYKERHDEGYVRDFLAGMTDRFATRTYRRIFLPRGYQDE